MDLKEKEYLEIFMAESLEEFDLLSRHLVELEKKPANQKLLAEVFRLLHNLKANAKAMGFMELSTLAHKQESIFSAIRNKEIAFKGQVVDVLFQGLDALGKIIRQIDKPSGKLVHQDQLSHLSIQLDKILNKEELQHQKVEESYYVRSQNIALSELIHIPIKKLDNLMNLVGELMIDRERILQLAKELDDEPLKTVSAHLYRITNEIQQDVMEARLVNVGFLFNKFPRIVRDISGIEGKEVELDISGQDIKIDRNILQIMTDSLLHLVRNAIVHGVENKTERKKRKKPALAKIWLNAENVRDAVLIQVKDDGRGIDAGIVQSHALKKGFVTEQQLDEMNEAEVLQLILEPGFSLSKDLTEYSGRGVGLDVVKHAVDSMGGKMTISSQQGKGTVFNLYLPTSLAVKGALLFEVRKSYYALPLIHIDSVVMMRPDELHRMGSVLFADVKGESLPLINISDVFFKEGVQPQKSESVNKIFLDIIILNHNNRKFGIIVENFVKQLDIVVKPLTKPVEEVSLFNGVTLLGNGEVCLVIDVPTLLKDYILKK